MGSLYGAASVRWTGVILVVTCIAGVAGDAGQDFASLTLTSLGSVTKLRLENAEFGPRQFLANDGQADPRVAFYTLSKGTTTFVMRSGDLVHSLDRGRVVGSRGLRRKWVVIEHAVGASGDGFRGVGAARSDVNEFGAADGRARTLRAYDALEWNDAWPGVRCRLSWVRQGTERTYVVAPGADPRVIQLRWDGVGSWKIDATGTAIASADDAHLRLLPPMAYQVGPTKRTRVDVRYRLTSAGDLSLAPGNYDHSRELVIDPILQSTYYSASGSSGGWGIAVHPRNGDVYIAGYLQSGTGLPALQGGAQVNAIVGMSGFVGRLDPTLQSAVQSTYVSGAAGSGMIALAIHPRTGDIYVAGETTSPDMPARGGGAEPAIDATRSDGFVSRLSADLRTIIQTTYLGGVRGQVLPGAIAINGTSGDVYVSGRAESNGAMLVRFNKELTTALGRIRLEGNVMAEGWGLDINQSTGDVYMIGLTESTDLLPTPGGAQPSPPSAPEAGFIVRYDAALSQALGSTYFGFGGIQSYNSSETVGPVLRVDPVSGDVFGVIEAVTNPYVATGFQHSVAGAGDVFVERLSPDLSTIVASTYLGGSAADIVTGAAFSPNGDFYVAGITRSMDFPGIGGGADPNFGSTQAGFVARLDPTLQTLKQSTYYHSGSNGAAVDALAISPTNGDVYITGEANSPVPELEGGVIPNYPQQISLFADYIAHLDPTLASSNQTTPNALTFLNHFAVPAGVTDVSQPLRISGITVPVLVSIAGGEYSLDGGPFTAAGGTAIRGQLVQLRQVASSTPGATVATTVTIGGLSTTWTTTTATGSNTTPSSFSFPPLNPVALGISVTSAPAIIGGLTAPAPISIVNGTYSIEGAPFTNQAGTVYGGQTVTVQQTTATQPATQANTTLTVGGVAGVFSTTTDPVSSTPHPFSFADVIYSDPSFPLPNAVAISDPVTVTGINVPVSVAVSEGSYSVNGGTFTTAPSSVSNFDNVALQVTSGSPGQTVSATLTIAGIPTTWNVTRLATSPTLPNPMVFPTITGVAPAILVNSADATVSGVTVPIPIQMRAGQYYNAALDINWGGDGVLQPGQVFHLRIPSSSTPGGLSTAIAVINSVTNYFNVVTAGGQLMPNPFHFDAQTGVAPGSTVLSNIVTISGVSTAVLVTVQGCEVNVAGSGFVSPQTQVSSGETMQLEMTAPAGAGQSVSCAVSVGTGSDTFTATSAGSSSGGGGGGGGGSGGGALGIEFEVILLGLTVWRARRSWCVRHGGERSRLRRLAERSPSGAQDQPQRAAIASARESLEESGDAHPGLSR